MDFFNSLWDNPDQLEVPNPHNFGAADLTAEKWIKHSSTYKLLCGTFHHPQTATGINKFFYEEQKKQLNQSVDSTSNKKQAQQYVVSKSNKRQTHKLVDFTSNQKQTPKRKDSTSDQDQAHQPGDSISMQDFEMDTSQTLNEENETDDASQTDVETFTGHNFQKHGYIPGLRRNPVQDKLSCLDTNEQAECLTLFKKFSSLCGNVILPCDRSDHFKFEVMYKKVQDEQREFCQDALKYWPDRVKDTNKVSDGFYRILNCFWMVKANKALELYPHCYKKKLVVPLHSGSIKVEMLKLSDLLQMGKIPFFCKFPRDERVKPTASGPKLLRSAHYHLTKDETVGSLHKLPVSQDPNAESLARLHKAQIVISSGALNTLVETHFNFSKQWTLPITVKEYRTIDKGKTAVKTIVFIDKPLPKQSMTPEECHRFVIKHGLKRLLLDRTHRCCFVFPIPGGIPLMKEDIKSCDEPCDNASVDDAKQEPQHPDPEKNEKEIVEDDMDLREESSDDSEAEKLVIEESVSKAVVEKKDREKRPVANPRSCDILARPRVAGEPSKTKEPFRRKDGQVIQKTSDGFTVPLSFTNVTYSSWVIRPENMEQSSLQQKRALKELLVIVRSRVDVCERSAGDYTALSISPKIEYQLEFSGEEATKEELAREWASLNFKPASQVLRVRVDRDDLEIVMTEKKDKAQLVADAHRFHGIRLSDSLQTLYSVFSEVSTLAKGSYLLNHTAEDNVFASLEECVEVAQENGKSVRNLKEYFSQQLSVASDSSPAWRKLDCSLVLPRHEQLKLMPALYRPKRSAATFTARTIPALKEKRGDQKGRGFSALQKKKKPKKKNKKKNKTIKTDKTDCPTDDED